MRSKLVRPAALIGLALAALIGLSAGGFADDATPSAPASNAAPAPAAPPSASPATATPAPASAAPAAPPAASPAPSNPPATTPAAPPPSQPEPPAPAASSPVSPPAPSPGAPAAPSTPPAGPAAPSGDSTGETVELAAHPFAFVEGKADRDEIYGAIRASLDTVRREMDKAGLKPAGKPLAVFIQSDDSGFRYHAGFPLDSAPAGKTSLSDTVKLGDTPAGKAMRFQHLGAYADIDATYDAITAFLDEKGIDAQDSFIEEYENDVKDADDPNLQVDIFVLMK